MNEAIKKKYSSGTLFDIINIMFMILFLFITLYPFWYVVINSFNTGLGVIENGGLIFFPREFTLENYEYVLSNEELYQSILVTLAQMILATVGHLIFTAVFAYGYMQTKLKGKGLYKAYCMITMFVSGGIIPFYLVILTLNLDNSFFVYIIPTLFSYWDVLIMRLFFMGISDSIIEAARIDGASEYRILFTFIMPLSLPVFAAVGTFFAIGKWNSYFESMLYMGDTPELRTFQHLLMDMVRSRGTGEGDLSFGKVVTRTKESVQHASIVISLIPIILIFPFMQKYMAAGMMTGAVKE